MENKFLIELLLLQFLCINAVFILSVLSETVETFHLRK